MDRPAVVAFSLSLTCHVALVMSSTIHPMHWVAPRPHRALDVIYDQPHRSPNQDKERFENQVTHLGSPLSPTLQSAGSQGLPGAQAPLPQIRIPDRAGSGFLPAFHESGSMPSASIDLTNLVEAAQGNPVLLSYFTAIREQIQRPANQQTWFAGGPNGGLVYVSFVLESNGRVRAATIVPERSSSPHALQEVAVRIIRASSPFAPFPPSFSESEKTIIVPLEFLLGTES